MSSRDNAPLIERHSAIATEGLDHAVLQWLQELSPYGICITDNNLCVQGWNLWMETASGRSRESVLGQNLLELFPDLVTRRLDSYFRRALLGEIGLLSAAFHNFVFPFEYSDADGTVSKMLQTARIVPLRQDEKIIGTMTIVEDVTQREQQSKAQAAKRQLARKVLQAEENERQRIARELHDSVNQLLSSSTFRLSAVEQQVSGYDKATGQKIKQATELVNRAIQEIRLVSRNLRPSELDDLGLHSALRSLASEVQERTGIVVHVDVEKLGRPVPSEIELTLYRIAQEALNNAVKHAHPSKIEIHLRLHRSLIELEVIDDGKGFDVNPGSASWKQGWGLANMRERAGLFQGKLTIESGPGKGVRIQVAIPATT